MRKVQIAVGLLLHVIPMSVLAEWPSPADTLALALLDSLQVGAISLNLSSDPDEAGRQLWGQFAKGELAKRYSQIEVPGGKSVWPVFRDRLVAVAIEKGFDSKSLVGALGQIEQNEERLTTKGQLYPIGAFVARARTGKVWVVPCHWESGYQPPKEGQRIPLQAKHIRIWAFAMGSGRQVGYVTCK